MNEKFILYMNVIEKFNLEFCICKIIYNKFIRTVLFTYNIANFLKKNNNKFMKDFTTYLSTAPVIALAWISITAGLIIEVNRFFPDPLVFAF
jgi:photosystem I subunit IX